MKISCYTRRIFCSILLVFILLFLFFGSHVLADTPLTGLKKAASGTGIAMEENLGKTLGKIFKSVLGIMGLLLLILFVVGGIMWTTSGGSPDKLKKAQGLLVNAIIGLIIVISSWAFMDFVVKGLAKAG